MSFAVSEGFVYVTGIDELCNNILHKAAINNKQNIARLLIESGIDISIKDKYNATVLIKASLKGHTDIVKLLLAVPGIDADPVFNSKALMCASAIGHHEIFKLLLPVRGVDVNIKSSDNNTALIWASEKDHHEVVKILLSVPGIDVNAKNNNNETAMMLTSKYHHDEVVKLLKAHGAI